jgi:ion transport protein
VIGFAFVPGVRESSTLLRLARLLRVVRIVRILPDLRILVTGVVRSLPPLGSMLLLTTVMLFIYGMLGWLLFADEIPQDWGNIGPRNAEPLRTADARGLPALHGARDGRAPVVVDLLRDLVLITVFFNAQALSEVLLELNLLHGHRSIVCDRRPHIEQASA